MSNHDEVDEIRERDEHREKFLRELLANPFGNPQGSELSRWLHKSLQPTTPPQEAEGGLLKTTNGAECSHEWESYVGFTESYSYCTKCEEKK